MAEAAKRTRQRYASHRGDAYAGEAHDTENQIALEESSHRADGKSAHVISVVDVQRGGLPTGQQEYPVVQGGQIGDGEHEQTPRAQNTTGLPQGRHRVFKRHEITVPDDHIEMPVRCGEFCRLEIHPLEVRRRLGFGIAPVLLVVDDWAARPAQLIAQEQGLLALMGLDLQDASPGRAQAPDGASDLPRDGQFDPRVPEFAGGMGTKQRAQRSVMWIGPDVAGRGGPARPAPTR